MQTKATNHSKIVLWTIAAIILIIVFFLYGWRINSNLEEKRMNNLLEEINDLYIQNEYIQSQYDELERQQENLHWSAEENRAKIDELWEEFIWLKGTWWTPWMLNKSWDAQLMPELVSTTEHDKFKELAADYGLDASTIREVENHYWIKEWVVLCITIAETSGWKFWAGKNNIGNVWNTDSNPRWNSYSNIWASLDAIGRTLTNKYLWKHQTLWCLSNAGHCTEWLTARYATSEHNREANMVSCLSAIYGKIDPSTFNIRR